ncbi:DUF3089 domain-containing protein [Parvularcula sp. ZS-1/3]|uniref:DUF3089 domain-containing protein n=1 Tax=Parvularcula mediterranea TaxID=2732508 RepID=A0A7Y3W4D8_9PROT|nr:DUF3089 domain-containing protein [Parvularcula mediterranea]NNU15172.1 DUF3089 domain-containing protein [Parvularcula mediterranea]
MTSLRIILLALMASLLGVGVLAFVFQDEVTLAVINPDRSYEAYTPPPAPDPSDDLAWFARRAGEGQAAIFIIHSNVYRGDGNWNAPFDRVTQSDFLAHVQIPAEAWPFLGRGAIWVPRYRQPTLFARFTQKQPGEGARETAYGDIAAAFRQFVAEAGPEKPLVVAGYGDGALFAGRLWLEAIEPNALLRDRTAAVYAMGMPLPARPFEDAVCGRRDEPRCVVSFAPVDTRFESYQERLRTRTLTLDGRGGLQSAQGVGKLCAPPPMAPTVTAFDGNTGKTVDFTHGASCADGLFVHQTPEDELIRQKRHFGQKWYPNGVNLFAGPLQKDVDQRIIGLLRARAKVTNTVPPLPDAEEIIESEINTIPR